MSAAIKTVGVIGAGRMGQPIIGHLASKGFTVLVHDLDASKKALIEARGASWSDTVAELAKNSDAILICVGYDRELRELISDQKIRKVPNTKNKTPISFIDELVKITNLKIKSK